MRDRFRWFLAGIVTSGLIVTACAGAGSATAPAGTTGSASPTQLPSSATPIAASPSATQDLSGVTLTLYQFASMPQAEKDLTTDFVKATGIQVDIQPIPDGGEAGMLAKWVAGERPDLLYWHGSIFWMSALSPADNLQDLSQEPVVAKLPATLVQGLNYNGVRGIPLVPPDIFGILYNKAIFTQLKLQPPKTAADLLTLCKQIRTANPKLNPMFQAGSQTFALQSIQAMMQSQVAKDDPSIADKLNTNKAKWTDAEFQAVYNVDAQVRDAGCNQNDFITGTFEQEQKTITDGSTAMIPWSTSLVYLIASKYPAEGIGFAPVSLTSDVTSYGYFGTETLVLPKSGDPKKEAAARVYLEYVTSTDYQKFLNAGKYYPVISGFDVPAGVPSAVQQANQDLTNAVPALAGGLACDYGDLPTFMQELYLNKISVAQVTANMQAAWERSCKAKGQPGF